MPTLVLLRHAHTGPGHDDRLRELTSRGRADAAELQERLRELRPDRAVVSTALRARQTWELADPGGAEVVHDARVYEASTDDLREVVGETPEGVSVLVLVGHNPAVERLAWELDDSPAARERTDRGMSAGALVVFEVDGWDLRGARLREPAAPPG